jgi:xanthine dehydrogenase accessory factor
MNGPEFFERIAELERTRTPFALATVVARHAPVSSHLGDRAIVFADGSMQGYVGGSCSRDVVRRQAVASMRSGTARLVQIRPGAPPDADDSSPVGIVVVPMSCTSEGAVDVYVEPHLPARVLLIAGFTPVAEALARLGALLDGYRVVRVVQEKELADLPAGEFAGALALPALREFLAGLDPNERGALAAVVATQGHYDEAALEALLTQDLPYVALLASRRRAAGVLELVQQRGAVRTRIDRVRNPAGLDIGARRPSDVAISILAEIVATAAVLEPHVVSPESLPDDQERDVACCGTHRA